MNERPLALAIWLRMARFVQRCNCLSNEHLAPSGIGIAQFEALAHVRAYQPVTQTELASRLTISIGGISRMLSRLEEAGLITRTPEWKVKHISLTEKGEELLATLYPAQVAFQASMFEEVLDEDELKQLSALMRKLQRHSLEKTAPVTIPTPHATSAETNDHEETN